MVLGVLFPDVVWASVLDVISDRFSGLDFIGFVWLRCLFFCGLLGVFVYLVRL